MKKAWKKWMKLSKKVVSVEASVVFGIIFIIVLTPLSLFLKIVNPNVFYGSSYKKKNGSFWVKMPKRKFDLKFARKQ